MKPIAFCPVVIAVFLSNAGTAAEFSPNRVVLLSSGLAELSATFPVAGRRVITFDAPLVQIDDILKSLVVTGSAVRVVSASLAGRQPLSDTFATLPIQPSDLENTLTLLTALKGVRVEVERMERKVTGMVIGIESISPSTGEDPGRNSSATRLSLTADDGSIEIIDVDSATRIRVLNDTIRAAISDALEAIAANRLVDLRTIEVIVDGPSTSADATLTYVADAPVWKPTWRVVLPATGEDGRMQGWAVLENRTGVEWNDVRLALSSGTPVALRQKLYESVSIPRIEAPLQVGRRLRPDIDQGVIGEAASAPLPPAAAAAPEGLQRRADASEGAAADSLLELRPEAPAADFTLRDLAAGQAIAATESLVAATFEVPGTVDLEVGRSLTLPFFDGDANVERVSVSQRSGSDQHPISAVRIANGSDVSLPGGIVTVYEEDVGFVGDAEFAGAAPGEERILPYALDTKVRVARSVESDSAIESARASEGFLVVDYGHVQKTAYKVEGDRNASRTLLIEHPANPGWSVQSDAKVLGRDGDLVRLEAEIAAGQTATIFVTETSLEAQRWSILDAPEQVVLDLLAIGDGIDPKLREPLGRILDVRGRAAQLESSIQQIDARIERIRIDQDRVRNNLNSVDQNGELGRTYVERLRSQEVEIATLETDRANAESGLNEARAELSRLVRALTL